MMRALAALALSLLALPAVAAAPQDSPPEAVERDGDVIRVLGPDGVTDVHATASRREASPEKPCVVAPGAVARESQRRGATVDPCGRVRGDAGAAPARPAREQRGGTPGRAPITIDRMTTRDTYASFTPGGTLTYMASADVYELSDGSQWLSGAGSYTRHGAAVESVEVIGSTIRYHLSAPALGLLYEQTDYDAGSHSAQGKLGPAGVLVLETQAGSTTAVLRGHARIVSNDATWYGNPAFNYYSSVAGSVVPFEVVYTHLSGTFNSGTFASAFSYSSAGWVDFEHPISTPPPIALTITGPGRIPDDFTTSYVATVRYEGGAVQDVSAAAAWTVAPASLASVAGGVLTVGHLSTPQQALTLRATFTQGAHSVDAEKQVLCVTDDPAEQPDVWPMYQANARHTGYLPISLDPAATFGLRWQRDVGGSFALNPVSGGDGKVFVTLQTYFSSVTNFFALRALDGQELWSKAYDDVFSVNPPSYAYGNVYVQVGNHGDDTWLRAYDAGSGEQLFQSPHGAQWERYFAPTLHEGNVYVNGGYYGGMYSFDAYTGAFRWFDSSLPQYDQWTPAVAGGRAYAYVGEYLPGLYVRSSTTGSPVQFIPDPGFDWDGWSMNLAPVIGGHDDVIAIHDGRLISFDILQGTIRWEVPSQFSGQPSVAHDKVFAIDGGRLVVLDEVTHAPLWSWQAPEGPLAGAMIVTDSHLLASTAQRVHAVDLITREAVWSYPVAGHLAMADHTLYVASDDGTLTAITAPQVVPAQLVSLEITGPDQVVESSSALYDAVAHYSNGAQATRTIQSEWSVAPSTYASIGDPGELETGLLIRPSHDVVLKARYTEHGQTVEATRPVRIVIGVGVKELFKRNLQAAIAIKMRAATDLEAALELERATRELGPPLVPLERAICREEEALILVQDSMGDLSELLWPGGGGPPPLVPRRPSRSGPTPCRP